MVKLSELLLKQWKKSVMRSEDKRVEKNSQSLLAIRDLLNDVKNYPEKYLENSSIIEALRSQSLLAKFSDKSKNIYASSINTHKRIAQNLLEGGFESLNKLRTSAQMALASSAHTKKLANKKTRFGLLQKIALLDSEKQMLREDLLLLTLAIEKSLRQGARYASQSNASVQALCLKEQREILDMLSLRKHSLNTNVKKLRDE